MMLEVSKRGKCGVWSAEFGCQIRREKLKGRQVNHSNVPSGRIGYVGEGPLSSILLASL